MRIIAGWRGGAPVLTGFPATAICDFRVGIGWGANVAVLGCKAKIVVLGNYYKKEEPKCISLKYK